MLKPLVLSLLLAGSFTVASNQAQAEDVNFGAISCSQFMENIGNADEAAVGNIFMWLDGYLSGVSGDTTMRPDAMGKFAEKLIDRCSKNPDLKLLDAAKQVGINGQ